MLITSVMPFMLSLTSGTCITLSLPANHLLGSPDSYFKTQVASSQQLTMLKKRAKFIPDLGKIDLVKQQKKYWTLISLILIEQYTDKTRDRDFITIASQGNILSTLSCKPCSLLLAYWILLISYQKVSVSHVITPLSALVHLFVLHHMEYFPCTSISSLGMV